MGTIAQCTALNVSDEKRCEETATSMNGLFCSFHSKQCQGLYKGYKSRNARLDSLSASPPQYLANHKIAISHNNFADIHTEELCHEIHDYLFLKYQLLERVIRARRLHHSRFFAMNYDYGHAKYLEALSTEKGTIVKALERIERRTAEVLYKNQKWFKWVRQCQDEEEALREKEQKRVKQEAAFFKRHWKATQERLSRLREREDRRKQDAFLEKVYKERQAQMEEEEDDGIDWDPIEEVIEDQRGNYIDLIHRFLWLVGPDKPLDSETKENSTFVEKMEGLQVSNTEDAVPSETSKPTESNVSINPEENPELVEQTPSSKKDKGGKKGKKAAKKSTPKAKDIAEDGKAATGSALALTKKKDAPQSSGQELDKSLIETREEMAERLKTGSEYDLNRIKGRLVGTIDTPVLSTRTVSFDDDEVQKLLGEVAEIKHLLFCRILLGHATLLPAAIRANSVEEFLADADVGVSDLRDLCLKMERPGLQDIRDACADLFRSEDEEDELEDNQLVNNDVRYEDDSDLFEEMIFKKGRRRGDLPEKWIPRREKEKEKAQEISKLDKMLGENSDGTKVDFGLIDDKKNFRRKKIRVKVCGRSIWNYPSDKAMNRGGWLHFSIIAKDSNLHEAITLCRHWDEFYELNILAVYQYFPGAKWAEWVGNRFRSQLLQLGFIVYFETAAPDAMELTKSYSSRGPRGTGRSHAAFEARNFMCAYIKRDDQVSRRLVQYLSMQSHQLLVLVRDAESGRLLIKPPEDERWLYRQKRGHGRASRTEWEIIKKVGPDFFEEMDKRRQWDFSFKEYYDVYVWDLLPGGSFPGLYNVVQRMLFKAHRCCSGPDIYNAEASVLKTLYRDRETDRIRDLKPGDKFKSIWDDIHSEGTRFIFSDYYMDNAVEEYKETKDGKKLIGHRVEESAPPKGLFYDEADALEDQVLFPEEFTDEGINPLAIGKIEPLRVWEEEGFSLRKFVENRMWDSDSDYDSDSEEDDEPSEEDDDDEDDEDEELEEDYEELDESRSAREDRVSRITKDLIENVTLKGMPEEMKEIARRLFLGNAREMPRNPSDPKVMHEDFMMYVDREKSKIFKEVWHKADLEPHAQTHYVEMLAMAKYSRRHNARDFINPVAHISLKLLDWLKVPGGQDSKDLHKALAKISPFFFSDFLDTDRGKSYKNSMMFNQEERAKNPPDIRTHTSNSFRPQDFWTEFDESADKIDSDYQDARITEYDIAIRPIIAHLYKSGVIRNRAENYYAGQAFGGKEPHRQSRDLFIDYRSMIETITMPKTMEDPAAVPTFPTTARFFARKHPSARFAVLTLWSAPHFYPLMIGPENHDGTSWRDLSDRQYIWMFVPKDMPNSEWSIHKTVGDRIRPFRWAFKDKVVARRDKILVMGVDEGECCMLAAAVTYAVQMRPWRWEVDLWKSWINVEVGFLEGLDGRWLN